MPAVSKSQFRLMKGIEKGSIPPKGGLSKSKAAEFVAGQSPQRLPQRKKAKKRKPSKKPHWSDRIK
jgi:hypothetical protein